MSLWAGYHLLSPALKKESGRQIHEANLNDWTIYCYCCSLNLFFEDITLQRRMLYVIYVICRYEVHSSYFEISSKAKVYFRADLFYVTWYLKNWLIEEKDSCNWEYNFNLNIMSGFVHIRICYINKESVFKSIGISPLRQVE